jgi:hypothetical protein
MHFALGYVYRSLIRTSIGWLVRWRRGGRLTSGCTVIIGMCSRLPDILPANLSCLRLARWADLKEVIIAVDCTRDQLPPSFTTKVCQEFKDLRVRFVFYSSMQSFVVEFLKLPYVYSWLSWSLAIREVKTKTFYIHDYDALLLGNVLKRRYQAFIDTGRIIQGVGWYWTNGIVTQDRLVSTFEAFVDTQWMRSKRPIDLFNKIGLLNGRRLDFDTLIFLQIRDTKPYQRGIVEMKEHELVHPAQMIHQYTVFRKFPGRPWNCAALLMIPCFYYLGGKQDAFSSACNQIAHRKGKTTALLNDNCLMNFELLELRHLNKMCLFMIQVFVHLQIEPFADFRRYVESFYSLVGIPPDQQWQMTGSKDQNEWIRKLVCKTEDSLL